MDAICIVFKKQNDGRGNACGTAWELQEPESNEHSNMISLILKD
jgi:hypothetical protein